MFRLARPFFLLVETPLHCGAGTDLGVVDLPIQRERHTGFPKVEASSLKGAIREAFEQIQLAEPQGPGPRLVERFPGLDGDNRKVYRQTLELLFGPEKGDLYGGALGFTDARLLLFPVRSARGVFAWITCPAVIHRFLKEMGLAGVTDLPPAPEAGTVPEASPLICRGEAVILEEYSFPVRRDKCTGELAEWLAGHVLAPGETFNYWREKMRNGVVVLADDDFRDLVNLTTEVTTRIRINPDTGTVEEGALFTEEYLPQDSVLYALALASPPLVSSEADRGILTQYDAHASVVLDFWSVGMPEVLQLGGNATIGKGLVRVQAMEVNHDGNK